ncbi:transposase [Nocardia terpenica]|nr:transposase [Nocardia terpenica]
MARKLDLDLIAEHYDGLPRLTGSLKFGHAAAALLVGKLSASGGRMRWPRRRKNMGRFDVRSTPPDTLRTRTIGIARQLNRSELVHALKRDLLYAHEGMVRARHLEGQAEQMWCPARAINEVIAWTTGYFGLPVEQMQREGRRVDDDALAHVSSAHSENINFFGTIEVDIDAELAHLGPTGYRPLRMRNTLFRCLAAGHTPHLSAYPEVRHVTVE